MNSRSWLQKFRDAGRGAVLGVTGQRSFVVHFPIAAAVVIAGCWFQVSVIEWGLLVICIAMVLAAELMNSSIETLAQAIQTEHDAKIGAALDIASGAVLIASVGAAITGGTIFLNRLLQSWG